MRRRHPGDPGTKVYLLIELNDLVLFDLLKATNWLLSVGLVETGHEAYAERVIADHSKRLVAPRRHSE